LLNFVGKGEIYFVKKRCDPLRRENWFAPAALIAGEGARGPRKSLDWYPPNAFKLTFPVDRFIIDSNTEDAQQCAP